MKKNVTVVISNHCNMDTIAKGCSYCCIQNRNTSPILSLEKIDSFIFEQLRNEEVNFFEFFGGEPTIHYHQISSIVNKFDFRYRMYTNGLFDFDKWLGTLERFSEICFSIDGPGIFNSKRGIGNNTFVTQKALENLNRSLSHGLPITVAIVPSTTAHYDNLEEIFRFFIDLGVRSFSLETPSIIQDEHLNKKFGKEQLDKIVEFFFSFIAKRFIEEDEEDKILFNLPKEFYPGQANNYPCSESNIAISPRGKIYHCRDTAANEEKLINTSKIEFFSDIKKIKEIENQHTCHVKVLQGFDSSSIVDEDNRIKVKAMYQVIKLMNKFYDDLIVKNDPEKSRETMNYISLFFTLNNLLLEAEKDNYES